MLHITLDQQQAELLTRAGQAIQVLDQQGRLIGFIEPAPSEEEIARARSRMALDEPEFSTAEVLEHLRSLEKR
jgi:hypothetical protein